MGGVKGENAERLRLTKAGCCQCRGQRGSRESEYRESSGAILIRTSFCGFHSTPIFLMVNNIDPLEFNHNMISHGWLVPASLSRHGVVPSVSCLLSELPFPAPLRRASPRKTPSRHRDGSSPAQRLCAIPSTHKIYAVNEGAGSVTVINAASGARYSVEVGREPIAIALNRATNRIYVVKRRQRFRERDRRRLAIRSLPQSLHRVFPIRWLWMRPRTRSM